MKYSVQVWRPYLKQDSALLEKVQKRFTRGINSLKGLKYEERLNKLGLDSFETRCLRADLVLAFKILRLKLHGCFRKYFELRNVMTRGNCLKLLSGGADLS